MRAEADSAPPNPKNLRFLVDATVREAASLIVAVATHNGARTQLGQIGDRLVQGISTALQERGIRRRVGADMFGMAPRAYLRKVRRLEESATDGGRTLWEVVYEHIARSEGLTLGEIRRRFHRDDHDLLRGVLGDLKESGLVLVSGRGPKALCRAATGVELGKRLRQQGGGADDLVWAVIYREGPLSKQTLQRRGGLRAPELDGILERLVAANQVSEYVEKGITFYRSSLFTPRKGGEHGWEGAIFDHFHAVVKTLSTFLIRPEDEASAASTYTFDLWPGHPLAQEVERLFSELRSGASALRARIDRYNAEQAPRETQRTILYLGMCQEDHRDPAER
jgi:hypothetical protein